MTDTNITGTESRAAIKGHPLHPMLIPFPIAALAGALLVDLAYLGTGDALWARMSMWLLGAGVIMGALAGLVGYMDFSKIPRARQQRVGWAHDVGNSKVNVIALMFTGWFGGELVYRYLIGMAAGAANEDTRRPRR